MGRLVSKSVTEKILIVTNATGDVYKKYFMKQIVKRAKLFERVTIIKTQSVDVIFFQTYIIFLN